MNRLLRLLAAVALFALVGATAAAASVNGDQATGVLLVTPDRGFLGNEEVRDAFDTYARDRNAELLFLSGVHSEAVLDEALAALEQRGAKRIDVLPLMLSATDPRWQQAEAWLGARQARGASLAIAPVYGASYLAVEDLAQRLRDAHTDKQRLLLVGYGARNADEARSMRSDLLRMGGFASTLDEGAIDAVVYPAGRDEAARSLRAQALKSLRAAHGALVLSVAFAPRDDSMMDFASWYANELPADAQAASSPLAGADALAQWMTFATNQLMLHQAPVDAADLGVIVLAHGADWFWNRDIQQALAPVATRHKLAWAFSMADPVVVERAVRKLEAQGVRAIVVVRVFGMADSFRHNVERMLGIDVAQGGHAAHTKAGHAHEMRMTGHDHAAMGHAGLAAAPRIRSAVPMVTVGGVEDSPLFARALLDQARKLSKHAARETVILVAHGQGDDIANQRWIDLLNSLATQMRTDGGDTFRAIRVATWREDWPAKSKTAIADVRNMVKEAQRDGGRALVIPARTNGRGAADRYLEGLDFGWGRGFAQSPLFADWVERQIRLGIRALDESGAAPAPPVRRAH